MHSQAFKWLPGRIVPIMGALPDMAHAHAHVCVCVLVLLVTPPLTLCRSWGLHEMYLMEYMSPIGACQMMTLAMKLIVDFAR